MTQSDLVGRQKCLSWMVLMVFLTIGTVFVEKKRFLQLVLKVVVVVLWFGRRSVELGKAQHVL